MLKYTLIIQISWGHCDPAKIVFYPNYFIWFDQSAHHLFDKAGANMGDLMDQYGVVAAYCGCSCGIHLSLKIW